MNAPWVTALIAVAAFALFWAIDRLARTRPLLDCWFRGALCVLLATAAVLNAINGGWGWTAFEGTVAVISGWFWWQAMQRRAVAKNGATS